MRTIDRVPAFEKDARRLLKGVYGPELPARLAVVLDALARDAVLPAAWKDHPLKGRWVGYRELHVWPDLLLVYRKIGADVLRVFRLGSHADLFG